MRNKDMPATYKQDLKEFTKAALQGLCASDNHSGERPESIAKDAVDIAEAALAELEKKNGQ